MSIVSGSDCFLNPETGKIEVYVPKERKHSCACNGHIRKGGICGSIVTSSNLCGAKDDIECEHKVLRIVGVNDQEP